MKLRPGQNVRRHPDGRLYRPPEPDSIIVGVLRDALKLSGRTQRWLAASVGLNYQTVSMMLSEHRHFNPSVRVVDAALRALEARLTVTVGETEPGNVRLALDAVHTATLRNLLGLRPRYEPHELIERVQALVASVAAAADRELLDMERPAWTPMLRKDNHAQEEIDRSDGTPVGRLGLAGCRPTTATVPVGEMPDGAPRTSHDRSRRAERSEPGTKRTRTGGGTPETKDRTRRVV